MVVDEAVGDERHVPVAEAGDVLGDEPGALAVVDADEEAPG